MIALALALAASTPPLTVEELVEVKDLSSLAASPDGRRVAFRVEAPSVERNRVALRWMVAPADGAAPARIVASGGIAFSNGAGVIEDEPPVWLPDSSGFLFRRHEEGRTQVWRAAANEAGAVQITDDPGGVLGFALAPAGDALTYAAGATGEAVAAAERDIRDNGVALGRRIDLSVGVIGGFDRGGGPESVRMTGDWFDREALLPSASRLARLSLADGVLRTVGDAAQPLLPQLSRRDPVLAAAACELIDCSDVHVSATIPIPGRAETLVTITDRHRRQTLFLMGEGKIRLLIEGRGLLSGSRVEWTPCAVTRHVALCVAASADAPPRLVSIGLDDGRITELFAPNAALEASLPAAARSLAWRDAEGRLFTGVRIDPSTDGPTPAPLVIQYYLCDGFLRGGVGDELPYQLLAARGFAVLCINKYVDRQRPRDAIAEYRTALSGIRAIVTQLTSEGIVDPARVGMHGLSFGSEVTMWLLRRSTLLKAASISSGQIEPALYWFQSYPGRDTPERLRSAWGLGAPGKKERWRKVAPLFGIEAISVPLLMQLPESEARWSIELITRLAGAGKPLDVYIFPDAGHIKFLPRQRAAANQRNLDWFSFWLGSEAAAAQADSDSVRRWQAIAERIRSGSPDHGPKARRQQSP